MTAETRTSATHTPTLMDRWKWSVQGRPHPTSMAIHCTAVLEIGDREIAALRESNAALLAACKALLSIDNPPAGEHGHIDTGEAIAMVRAAIAAVEETQNDNA